MRMWMVNPRILCRQHLLGEHLELHMTMGAVNKGISLRGYLSGDLLEPQNLHSRHEELVTEMLRRGYRHLSPLPTQRKPVQAHLIDRKAAQIELLRRCPNCREREDKTNKKRQTI